MTMQFFGDSLVKRSFSFHSGENVDIIRRVFYGKLYTDEIRSHKSFLRIKIESHYKVRS